MAEQPSTQPSQGSPPNSTRQLIAAKASSKVVISESVIGQAIVPEAETILLHSF